MACLAVTGNRNARLARLRELVPLDHAIVGIDLADRKQMLVVTDHDSKVLWAMSGGRAGPEVAESWGWPERVCTLPF